MPRPNPFSRKPNDDQSPETMMFPTDDTQMMDEPVPANADDADSTIIMPRVDDPPYHPQQMPTRRPQQQQPQQQPQQMQLVSPVRGEWSETVTRRTRGLSCPAQ